MPKWLNFSEMATKKFCFGKASHFFFKNIVSWSDVFWIQTCRELNPPQDMPIIPTLPEHQGCRFIQFIHSTASSCSCSTYSSCTFPVESPQPLISTLTPAYLLKLKNKVNIDGYPTLVVMTSDLLINVVLTLKSAAVSPIVHSNSWVSDHSCFTVLSNAFKQHLRDWHKQWSDWWIVVGE